MIYPRGNGERGTWRPVAREDGTVAAAVFCPYCGRRNDVEHEPDAGHMVRCAFCGTFSLVCCEGWPVLKRRK